jgi:hypothetical protein
MASWLVGALCAGCVPRAAPRFQPTAVPKGEGAIFGHVKVIGADLKELTGSCTVEFANAAGELERSIPLGEDGWVFTTAGIGPAFLLKVYCSRASYTGRPLYQSRNLSFEVEGNDKITYFGHIWIHLDYGPKSTGENVGSALGGLAGAISMGAGMSSRLSETGVGMGAMGDVKDQFAEAVEVYQDRFGSAAEALTPSAFVASKPIEYALGPAPTRAGGFELGQPLSAAKASCTGAHLSWSKLTDHSFSCEGTLADIGMPAKVTLTSCAHEACAIVLDTGPDGLAWQPLVERFLSLSKQLEHDYGDKHDRDSDPLSDCSDGIQKCFAIGRARTSVRWRWTGKRSLTVVLDGGPPGGAPSLRLVYRAGTDLPKQ